MAMTTRNIGASELFEVFGSPMCKARDTHGTIYQLSTRKLADRSALIDGVSVSMVGIIVSARPHDICVPSEMRVAGRSIE